MWRHTFGRGEEAEGGRCCSDATCSLVPRVGSVLRSVPCDAVVVCEGELAMTMRLHCTPASSTPWYCVPTSTKTWVQIDLDMVVEIGERGEENNRGKGRGKKKKG